MSLLQLCITALAEDDSGRRVNAFSTFFLVVSSRSPRNISLFNLNVCCDESWENEMILGNSKPLFFRCTSIYLSIIIIMSSCLLRLFVFTFRSCFSSFLRSFFKFFDAALQLLTYVLVSRNEKSPL